MSESILATHYFKIAHTVRFRIKESEHKASCSYEIFIESIEGRHYDIRLHKINFLLNGEEVENKFATITKEFADAFFPATFAIANQKLLISESQKIFDRVHKKELELAEACEGPGLDYIRDSYANVIRDKVQLNHYFSSMNMIEALNFSLQNQESQENVALAWNVNPVEKTVWKGQTLYNKENNALRFTSNTIDSDAFIAALNSYNEDTAFGINPDTAQLTASCNHEIKFVTKGLNFKSSQTHLKLTVDSLFDYEETLSIIAQQ